MAQKSEDPRGVPSHRDAEVVVKARSLVPKPEVTDAFVVFDVCHRDILVHLDELIELTSRQPVDLDEQARVQAREVIAFFAGPAREHNYDEELHVFPTLMQCDDQEVKNAAETLCEDHAWIELYWLDIEPQLAALADPTSTFDRRTLRTAVEVFERLMRDHIALEESLLYPQLRGRLKSTVVRSISREMAARRDAQSTRIESD
jgi:hemerythrin-like domain-containing protein